MAKKKVKKSSDESDGASVAFDQERLTWIKKCESEVEDCRLWHEEAKAKYGLARAEHKLWVAKRNRIIAKTEDPSEVEDAQREVENARNRMSKAKAFADSTKDAWKGAEETLAKALTEQMPLLDAADRAQREREQLGATSA